MRAQPKKGVLGTGTTQKVGVLGGAQPNKEPAPMAEGSNA